MYQTRNVCFDAGLWKAYNYKCYNSEDLLVKKYARALKVVEDEVLGEKCCQMENMRCMAYVDCAPKYKQLMKESKMKKELMNEMTKTMKEP